jgi:hypothetical protein
MQWRRRFSYLDRYIDACGMLRHRTSTLAANYHCYHLESAGSLVVQYLRAIP